MSVPTARDLCRDIACPSCDAAPHEPCVREGSGQPTWDLHTSRVKAALADPAVLHLADLTRELGSALAAARAAFGGGR